MIISGGGGDAYPVGEFADHAVPRSVGHLLAVLAVGDQPYLVVDVEVLATDLVRQLDAVALVAVVQN